VTTHRFLGTTAAAHDPRAGDGFGTWAGIALKLGALARRVRERAAEELRYRQAMRELGRLTDRDLDDIGLGRADLPELARRHARAAAG
jgi:uncharacterized protein YjiS (DUF1127 family)